MTSYQAKRRIEQALPIIKTERLSGCRSLDLSTVFLFLKKVFETQNSPRPKRLEQELSLQKATWFDLDQWAREHEHKTHCPINARTLAATIVEDATKSGVLPDESAIAHIQNLLSHGTVQSRFINVLQSSWNALEQALTAEQDPSNQRIQIIASTIVEQFMSNFHS